MTAFTPALDSALTGPSAVVFEALQFDLPSYTLRLLTVMATTSFTVDGSTATFTGKDAIYGTIDTIDGADDGIGDTAPAMRVTLYPATDAAAATLSAANMQGCRVRRWFGAMVKTTGAAVADPYLLFDGVIDVPTLTIDKGVRSLEIACVSGFELFFENEEGFRLSDSNHQRVWPGETGLSNMSGVAKQIFWGVAGSSGAASSGAGSGGSFGGMQISGAPGFSQRMMSQL